MEKIKKSRIVAKTTQKWWQHYNDYQKLIRYNELKDYLVWIKSENLKPKPELEGEEMVRPVLHNIYI